MILWTILTVMAAVASAALTIAFVRFFDAGASGGGVLQALKAQLAVIDAQVIAGTVDAAQADALRVAVMNRLLGEDRPPTPPVASPARRLSKPAVIGLVLGLTLLFALAAAALYAKLGPPSLGSLSSVALSEPAGGAHPGGGDVRGMIAQLETKLKQSPDYHQGWSMLGWSYFQTGRYREAAEAYGRAAALDASDTESLSARGESLARASGSQVTPAALDAFRKALAHDPGDPRALYFLAVAKDQRGDHKGAMDDWIALLRTAPEGAPWAAEVRTFVEGEARKRGEDISARLLPAAAATGPASAMALTAPGPDSAQVAAAGQMSDADRQVMIAGMVDGLEARLKSNPKDVDGWIRLMRARMVLGQADRASAAFRTAGKAFAGSAGDQAHLRREAKNLAVPGA
jgi:cytochrome c-type biogenesis protein CcmH